jgi:TatD DNase family protein
MIIDAHCHLQSPHFEHALTEVIADAHAVGVRAIVNAATGPDDWERCRRIAADHPMVIHSVGIHPWYIPAHYKSLLSGVAQSALDEARSIGEIGLDTRFSPHPLEVQREVFSFFLDQAVERSLPAVIHCMGEFGELIRLLKRFRATPPLIIHSFNGSPELAADLRRFNIFFSLGGILTYGDSAKRRDMVRSVYPDRLLLETDSPDILPRGCAGEFNVPKNIRLNLNAAAHLLGREAEEVEETIFRTSARIFNVDIQDTP